MADCRIDGAVKAGSQQQWFSRASAWKEWQGLNRNTVFAGCENPLPGEWPDRAVTRIAEAPGGPGIRLRHLMTFRLGGGKPGSGIRNVVDDRGGEVMTSQKRTVKQGPAQE